MTIGMDEVNEIIEREKNEFITLTCRDAPKDLSPLAHIPESPTEKDHGKNDNTENKKHVTSISVPSSSSSLNKLSDWLSSVLRVYHCPEAISNQVMLANEEIFINIATYAYPMDGEVTVRIGKKGNLLALQYEDEGVPFNPLEMPAPEINVPLEERKIGGLGIFIVRQIMDNVKYKRENNKNKLTLYKIIS
jgi:anti-sigma regulatory factor (Ser/Thr protein kinase)